MSKGGDREDLVAVVDSDATVRQLVETWLNDASLDVETFSDERALYAATQIRPIVICLDIEPSTGELEVLSNLQARFEQAAIVAFCKDPEAAAASPLVQDHVYDIVAKPLRRPRVVPAVQRGVERGQLKRQLLRLQAEAGGRHDLGSLVAGSSSMQELLRQVSRALPSEIPVALYGEPGTGKELIARIIHQGGSRASGPFVAINCASIPESLHEPELVGHERGAFRGVEGVHRGRFEEAHGGTLFLEEVASLSPLTQATLIRFIQERSVRRMGGAEELPVDVRVISATRKDLESEVKAGRFREDLYFRLVAYPIRVPSLRERKEDIPALVDQSLKRLGTEGRREVSRVSPEAMQALLSYPWPGNVQELDGAVHRAVLSSSGEILELENLPPELRVAVGTTPVASFSEDILPLRELERRAIQNALRSTGGSVDKAAKLLGMGRATLYRRLAKYDSFGEEDAEVD